MERTHATDLHTLILSPRTLLVLCGPAGAGKSTFTRKLVAAHKDQGFAETTIVSSDYCRALVCDNEESQQVNRDAFDLFHYIIHKRMLQNRFTIADSTALTSEARQRLLGVAAHHQYATCLLIFNMPLEVCIQRDKRRRRQVGEQVILYQASLLQEALQAIPQEQWQRVHILEGPASTVDIVVRERV